MTTISVVCTINIASYSFSYFKLCIWMQYNLHNHLCFTFCTQKGSDDVHSKSLSIVSYIGCGVSIICLLITVVTILLFRYTHLILIKYISMYIYICFVCLHRKTVFKATQHLIHLNLATALLLGLIVFVSGIETATENTVS